MILQPPEMSTHGLNLSCSFPGKEAARNQPIRRPTVISIDKSMEPKTHKRSCEKQPIEEDEQQQQQPWIPSSKKSKGESQSRHHPTEEKKNDHIGTVVEGRRDFPTAVENQHAIELVSLLVECVDAMRLKDIPIMDKCLAKLGGLASPTGTSIFRVAAYFVEAMALRMAREWPHHFTIVEPKAQTNAGVALRLLNHITPIVKFLHFTCNEILLREFEGKERVHVIDLDIKEGLQWPGFFHSMATRAHPPLHLRITGIGMSKKELSETGDRLSHFAEALSLPFEFHPVVERLEDLRIWMVQLKEEETVGVNCVLQLHQVLYNGGILMGLLEVICRMNPSIVILAEQEAADNGGSLDERICTSLRYYSSIFDMLECAIGGEEEGGWRRVVEGVFGREIRNIVVCEGGERYERHEEFEEWRRIMVEGGFKCVEIKEREMLQSQMLLQMYNECEGFSVEKMESVEEGGEALTLKWIEQRLYSVSAWSPVEVDGGNNSPFSSSPLVRDP